MKFVGEKLAVWSSLKSKNGMCMEIWFVKFYDVIRCLKLTHGQE